MKKKMVVVILSLAMAGMFSACGSETADTTNYDTDYDTPSSEYIPETDTDDTSASEEDWLEEEDEEEEEDMTTAQENAYESAKNYLDTMAFSKQGLIDQLSSEYGEGYDVEDAKFAVEKLEEKGEVDWNEQAEKAAQEYLDTMSFSKDGLIEQLESEYGSNFTHEQAVHGADVAYQ